MARPWKYKKKYAKKLIEWTESYSRLGLTSTDEHGKEVVNNVPFLVNFIKSLKDNKGKPCSVSTFYHWKDAKKEDGSPRFPELLEALEEFNELREKMIVGNGIMGKYNASFAIFAAKNLLHWKDRSDITTGDEKMNFNIYAPAKKSMETEPGQSGESTGE